MKPLIETNPYLMNKEHRDASIALSVRSSCGVEGIVARPLPIDHINIDSSRSRELLSKIKKQLAA